MSQVPSYGASRHYDADYFGWQNANIDAKTRLKLPSFVKHIKESDTVLDFGCAGGAMLAGLPGKRKIGVELSDVARASAEREYGLETYKSLAEVPDGIVDVAVSNHTLEHIAAPFDALVALRSKLKPDGRLVLVLPIDDWRALRRWDPNDINRHLYTWTPMNIGNLLDEAGYHPQSIRIIHRALMRGFDRLSKLPSPAFNALSWAYSHARHRQQLVAVAQLKS